MHSALEYSTATLRTTEVCFHRSTRVQVKYSLCLFKRNITRTIIVKKITTTKRTRQEYIKILILCLMNHFPLKPMYKYNFHSDYAQSDEFLSIIQLQYYIINNMASHNIILVLLSTVRTSHMGSRDDLPVLQYEYGTRVHSITGSTGVGRGGTADAATICSNVSRSLSSFIQYKL